MPPRGLGTGEGTSPRARVSKRRAFRHGHKHNVPCACAVYLRAIMVRRAPGHAPCTSVDSR
ncbi:hypothetical protein BURMUCGD1_1094 [Burkholderia multivorans CGD1]|nr:hypothetical protein BURMUCGD1_1094 [Burkholderia multivorans CGD1]